jgi:hypothetical protein
MLILCTFLSSRAMKATMRLNPLLLLLLLPLLFVISLVLTESVSLNNGNGSNDINDRERETAFDEQQLLGDYAENNNNQIKIRCEECLLIAQYIRNKLKEIDIVTDANTIDDEEELQLHHARGGRRKMMHGRSEILIRRKLENLCSDERNVDIDEGASDANNNNESKTKLTKLERVHCHRLLFGDEHRLDTFNSILDHFYEHGASDENSLHEFSEFLCVHSKICAEEFIDHLLPGIANIEHEEL